MNHCIHVTLSPCIVARFTVTEVYVVNGMDYEGNKEHFILEEYDIQSDAETQMEFLRKYENFSRSTEVEINEKWKKTHRKKHKKGIFY